ncbi:MAG: alpha/beta hydrolase [Anaerovoracaceae bacterium]
MYENFQLKTVDSKEKNIVGYHWKVFSPKYVVCLIHGIGEYAGRYDRVAGYMEKSHIAMLSMDLRGHGESFGTRGHCAPRKEVLKDVDALIEEGKSRYPGIPLILYGHSMGGNIALDYAKRGKNNHIPVGYVISAPWIELTRPVSKPLYIALKVFSRITPSLTIDTGIDEDKLGHPKMIGGYKADPLVHGRISLLAAAEGFDIGNALADNTLKDNQGAAGTPMLLLHGEEDQVCKITGSQKVAAYRNENFKFIQLPGLFHEIHNGGNENTGEEVIQKITQWILALEG